MFRYNLAMAQSSFILGCDVIGSARIASLSYSVITIIYFTPLIDVTGNRPVLFEDMFPLIGPF